MSCSSDINLHVISENITIPSEEGQYHFKVTENSKLFIKNYEPIVFNHTFESNDEKNVANAVSNVSLISYDNIPNGKYLILVNAHILNNSDDYDYTYYSSSTLKLYTSKNDLFYSTYLNNHSSNISTHTIIEITNNILDIIVKSSECDNHQFDNFNVTLIHL